MISFLRRDFGKYAQVTVVWNLFCFQLVGEIRYFVKAKIGQSADDLFYPLFNYCKRWRILLISHLCDMTSEWSVVNECNVSLCHLQKVDVLSLFFFIFVISFCITLFSRYWKDNTTVWCKGQLFRSFVWISSTNICTSTIKRGLVNYFDSILWCFSVRQIEEFAMLYILELFAWMFTI